MGIESLITVNITLQGNVPSLPGFGAALIAADTTVGGSARVLGPYAQPADLVTAGFSTTSPTYYAASKYFAQNPSPTQFYVGRRTNHFTQKVKFTPYPAGGGPVNGDIFNVNVGASAGVGGTLMSFTVSGSPTLSALCTSLAAALNTALGTSECAAVGGTTIEFTSASASTLREFQNQSPLILGQLEDTTDPGIVADLTAIWNANKNWYGLLLDSNSQNEILAAAAWVESNGRLFAASSADTQIFNSSSTTDVAASAQTSAYTRTGIFALQNSNMSFFGAAMLGSRFTQTPGSDTWAYKTLASVAVDTLPAGWDTNALAKNATVYEKLLGVNSTVGGRSAQGEYMDTVRFVDWLHANIQGAVLNLLLGAQKIPFDDTGISMVTSTISAVLAQGVTNGGLVKGSFSVTAPLASAVSSIDRGNRVLNGVKFTGQLAGAVQTLVINGTLTN